MEFIAHARKNADDEWDEPHLLLDHLTGTAKLAEQFAAKFGSAEWGRVLGLAHDVGKGRSVWQGYIRQKSGYDAEESDCITGKIPHAAHGAKLVEERFGKAIGRVLAYSVAGHHAGLPDWSSTEGAGRSALQIQMDRVKDLNDIVTWVKEQAASGHTLFLPRQFARGLDVSLWIRMQFSSLVDADYLDTENYMDGDKASSRGGYCSISELLERFNTYIIDFDNNAENTAVNEIRRNVKAKCIEAAGGPQGTYSLSVPTGGGKTLSSMAFALNHAKRHSLDRIIYVIPYTSIIEQNADVFRSVLGDDQVVEHHSNLLEENASHKARLASENWDAPVIVTTSVQFFESLFAAKSGRCRKLHNIVNSVVILDEAQLLPVGYLEPILETMQLLGEHYGVTFVISTATQPALGERLVDDKLFKGLKKIREIIGDDETVKDLYKSLERVEVQLPEDLNEPENWEQLAEKLQQYEQVLCVVNDRKSCRELHALMPEGTYHLSALMCGQHRSEIIKQIRQKLQDGQPIRVISTQLVEAGVDFDFPIVYRALAGLDSIAQAAGRCNRNGKLSAKGKVVVFVPPRKSPSGILRKASETAQQMLSQNRVEPLKYGLFEKYFAELYWKANSLDDKGIISLLTPETAELGISFRTAAEKFCIVDDSQTKTVLVRYGEGSHWIDLLKNQGPDRWLMRKLQRYSVNIYDREFNTMRDRGSIEEICPNVFALTSEIEYSKSVGLLPDGAEYNPEQFII